MKCFKKRGLLLIALSLTLVGCGKSESDELLTSPHIKQTDIMGTTAKITDYTANTEEAVAEALKIAEDYDSWLSSDQTDSFVNKINSNAGIAPVEVNSGVYELIKATYELSAQKTGFDVTIGPLTQLWHIGFPDAKKPSQKEIDTVLPYINYEFIKLDDEKQTVYLTEKEAKLDMGSMTKGYVARLMAEELKANGVKNAIVDLGSSSLYVIGHGPRGKDTEWNVGIKDPNNPNGNNIGLLSAKDQFISTSGIYERYLEIDDVKYAHILNPETGYPFENDVQSVTIVGDDNFSYGDGVTTAVFALGTRKGYDYILEHDLQAIFIDKDDKIYLTPGLEDKFTLNSDSKYEISDINRLSGNQ